MRSLTEEELAVFNRHAPSEFFFLPSISGMAEKVAYKNGPMDDVELFEDYTDATAYSEVQIPFMQLWKLTCGSEDGIGWLIETPNLPRRVGRNYVAVYRKQAFSADHMPKANIVMKVKRFMALEIPDQACILMFANTPDFGS